MNKEVMKQLQDNLSEAISNTPSKAVHYFPFLAAFFFSLLFALSVMRYLSEINAISGARTFMGW